MQTNNGENAGSLISFYIREKVIVYIVHVPVLKPIQKALSNKILAPK